MRSRTDTLMRGTAGIRWMSGLALLLATATQAALSVSAQAASPQQEPPGYRQPLHSPDRLYAEASGSLQARDHFYRGSVIAAEELDQMRAGFNIGVLDVDFGASLHTLIDNSVELVSVVNFTRAGADIVSQSFSAPAGVASRVGPGTGLTVTDMAPGSVELAGLASFSGVALNDLKGFTAALHNITRDAIVSGVVSNASGRDIQQRINIDVRLNNVGELKAARQRAAIVDSFSGILR
ncbi:MAG TPA: hypothetical protein VK991_05375 [Halomonas sp.]|nr:hypothetical protein [Halomonas sp.]